MTTGASGRSYAVTLAFPNKKRIEKVAMKTDGNRQKNLYPIYISIFLAETGPESRKNGIKNG
jgi:hypothetical protein